MTLYHDYNQLVVDLLARVNATHEHVLSADCNRARTLGFSTIHPITGEGALFEIPYVDLWAQVQSEAIPRRTGQALRHFHTRATLAEQYTLGCTPEEQLEKDRFRRRAGRAGNPVATVVPSFEDDTEVSPALEEEFIAAMAMETEEIYRSNLLLLVQTKSEGLDILAAIIVRSTSTDHVTRLTPKGAFWVPVLEGPRRGTIEESHGVVWEKAQQSYPVLADLIPQGTFQWWSPNFWEISQDLSKFPSVDDILSEEPPESV